ncbi:expressed protein [Phakopsora pachyrhizi]|uniref:Expressed protein n=1 Tax=Phakopsora pachyrhizi TaxID=170000 RepID=A0AAV0BVN9_PHAPC|nr:expressed protein [Phakopsora pachyrhizi]
MKFEVHWKKERKNRRTERDICIYYKERNFYDNILFVLIDSVNSSSFVFQFFCPCPSLTDFQEQTYSSDPFLPGRLKSYSNNVLTAASCQEEFFKNYKPEGSSGKRNALLPDGFSWKRNSQPPEEYSKRKFTLPSLNDMIAGVKCCECPKNEDNKIYPLQPPKVPSIFNGTIHYGSFPPPKKSHHSQQQPLLSPIEPKFALGQPRTQNFGQIKATGHRDYRKRMTRARENEPLKGIRLTPRQGTSYNTSTSNSTPRQRVPMACTFCRARKLRCSPYPGPCGHCDRRGQVCKYSISSDFPTTLSSEHYHKNSDSSDHKQQRQQHDLLSPTESLSSTSSILSANLKNEHSKIES